MLILTRKIGDILHIGDDIKIHIIEIKTRSRHGTSVRLGIVAPPDVRILRDEAKLKEPRVVEPETI